MDFSVEETNTNAQPQGQPQAPDVEVDLSAFANTSHDLNMSDIQTTDVAMGETADALDVNKEYDDLFGIDDGTGGDGLDLDLDLGMADESTFDDMFFASANDGNLSGGGEMEHQLDSAFFGLE